MSSPLAASGHETFSPPTSPISQRNNSLSPSTSPIKCSSSDNRESSTCSSASPPYKRVCIARQPGQVSRSSIRRNLIGASTEATNINPNCDEYNFAASNLPEHLPGEGRAETSVESFARVADRDPPGEDFSSDNVSSSTEEMLSSDDADFFDPSDEVGSDDNCLTDSSADALALSDSSGDISDASNSSGSSTASTPPLYFGSDASKQGAVLELMDLYISERWTKKSLLKTLKLLKSKLPQPNSIPSSLHLLFKYVESFGTPVSAVKHYYCSKCQISKHTYNADCCNCKKKDPTGYFYTFPIRPQLKHMFEHRNLADLIDTYKLECERNNLGSEDICDIVDGSENARVKLHLKDKYDIVLLWNTDGVSMSRSSSMELWPILCVICEVPPRMRSSFMIVSGVWCDTKKPPGNLLLKHFSESLSESFQSGGVKWIHPKSEENCQSKVAAPALSADAPAKAKALFVKEFMHRYGCNVCEQKTVRIPLSNVDIARGKTRRKRRFLYQEHEARLRSGERMDLQGRKALQLGEPQKGVIGPAVVSNLPLFDRGTCVTTEYMHSVCLGVAKYFLSLMCFVRGPWYINQKIEDIDEFLTSIKVPDYINRTLEPLSRIKFWKASAFRFWLLFASLPALKPHLSKPYFQHWMLLVNAVYILLQDKITSQELQIAELQLTAFVADVCILYSPQYYTYNVHNLLHLPLLVKRWGPLWSTSTFIFENYNGVLSGLIHGTKHKGQELLNNMKMSIGVENLRHAVRGDPKRVPKRLVAQVLGKQLKVNLCASMQEAVNQIGLFDYTIHKRAKFNDIFYTSRSYDEKKKRCNSQICFSVDQVHKKYGVIEYFLQTATDVFCVVNTYRIEHRSILFHESTLYKVKHLPPVSLTHTYVVCPLNCVINKLIKVGMYLCKRPNDFEVNL